MDASQSSITSDVPIKRDGDLTEPTPVRLDTAAQLLKIAYSQLF